MTLHLPTLLMACIGALAMSAALMTFFGATQRVYRGFWWWTGAQWLLTLGVALQLSDDSLAGLTPLPSLLLISWPVLVLAGMRRFYSRQGPALPAIGDWLLFAIAYLGWLAVWAARAELAGRIAAFAAGSAALQLYTAIVLSRFSDYRTSAGLKALAVCAAFAGLLQVVRLSFALGHIESGTPPDSWLIGSGPVLLLPALLMVYLGLQLSYERSESRLRAVQRRLRFLADTDTLTLMPNRRHFYALARRSLATPGTAPTALLMLDIDYFKRLNDYHGHAVGDVALRQVAASIRDTLRSQDVAGRLGGDEFALLLPQTGSAEAAAVAGRIAQRAARAPNERAMSSLTLSFGVVEIQPLETIDQALARADEALYQAKRQGRDRAVVGQVEVPKRASAVAPTLGKAG
jgi:diguanylate cyclase (GGDEF)-like protein